MAARRIIPSGGWASLGLALRRLATCRRAVGTLVELKWSIPLTTFLRQSQKMRGKKLEGVLSRSFGHTHSPSSGSC